MVIIPRANMKKSWGQNILLNRINLPWTRLINISGLPLTLMNGTSIKNAKYRTANTILYLYHLPEGFNA